MPSTRLKINKREVQAYLDGKNGVEALLDDAAGKAAAAAVANAPVVDGDYRDSITVVTERTDRMVKRVTATVPYALKVEADTGNLARALDAAR